MIINPAFSALMPTNQRLLSALNLSEQQIQQLMNPSESDPCFEKPILDMIEFLQALEKKKVLICGDYDCDGICSTSLLVKFCRRLNIEVGFYIPNRITDGYGLSEAIIQNAALKGYTAIICVDTGVNEHETLEVARSLGLQIAIIDHHIINEQPICDVLLHPSLLSDYYHSMCATGLVYLLLEHYQPTDEEKALACVATLGDMMPLWNKNREIVRIGYQILQTRSISSIDYLKDDIKANYNHSTIPYQIVPKINAVGRLADLANPNNLVRYFCDLSAEQQLSFSYQVNQINLQRKKLSQEAYQSAVSIMRDESVIVVGDASFHEGIVGIVAGQLSSRFQKPALVFSRNEKGYKGSGRSSTVSLHHLLSEVKMTSFHFGGHDKAAGVELLEESIDQLRDELVLLMEKEEILLDDQIFYVCDSKDFSIQQITELDQFYPFGEDFQLPQLVLKLEGTLKKLKNTTLKWATESMDFLTFSGVPDQIEINDHTFVVGKIGINHYNGNQKLQFIIDGFLENPL